MPQLIIASGENTLAAELRALECDYHMQPLPLADAVIRADGATEDDTPLVMIERKTVRDLIASIKDGRYKEQSARLSQLTCPVWWIIEGTVPRYPNHKSDHNMMFGAIATLGLIKRFTPVRTATTAETALLLRKLIDKSAQYKLSTQNVQQEGGVAAASAESIPHKRFKGDCITKTNIQHLMLAQIPGVSVARAEAILNTIPLADILSGTPIPRNIKCAGSGKASAGPRAIPKNVIAAIEDYLQPKQQTE